MEEEFGDGEELLMKFLKKSMFKEAAVVLAAVTPLLSEPDPEKSFEN